MIFVMVGTNEAPFDRLLRALDHVTGTEPLLVQHGSSLVRPRAATCVDFLPYEAVVDYVREARVVVTHAGVGSIITVLAARKRPVVVPRLRRFGEAVDDHQLLLGRRLHEAELVDLAENPADLPAVVARPAEPASPFAPTGDLAGELREYLASCTCRAGRVAPA